MRHFVEKKVVKPFQELLRQGISPHSLALSLAVGVAFGLIPLWGTSTVLCLLAGTVFRLNHPAMQLVNYLMTPLQLACYIPFIKLGVMLFGGEETFVLSAEELAQQFSADWTGTLLSLGMLQVWAVAAWAMVLPGMLLVLYAVGRPVLSRVVSQD